MKVLFLDIDGVLNSEQSAWYYNRKGFANGGLSDAACPIACSNLHRILDEHPDLKICVSSSWRIGETLESMRHVLYEFAQIPPERIIGLTPTSREFEGAVRGDQIAEWLRGHPEVTKFVIVDDDSDMAHLLPSLVKTSWRHGLLMKDALEIIDRFFYPWQYVQGYDYNNFKNEQTINFSVVRATGEGAEKVVTTYWGLKASCPNPSATDAEMEEWALAKEVNTEKRWFAQRFFIKSTEALNEVLGRIKE